ncbi:MAG: CHAT domain-containing protein [Salinibacter sp.]
MLAFLLGVVLVAAPAGSTDNLEACLKLASSNSPPPITWGENIPRMWASSPPVPLDSVRAYLPHVRKARNCFRSLDPSEVSLPYLGNIMRTFHVETALLAALQRFSEAFRTFDEARSYLKSSASIPTANPEIRPGWTRSLHQNQGLLHYYLGDLSSAINHYLKAFQNTLKDEVGTRITLLSDVGVLHQRMQDYRSAKYYFDRAARLFQKSDRTRETHPSQWARLSFRRADFLLEKTLNTEFDREALERARKLAARSRTVTSPGTENYADFSLTLSETLGYLGHFERAYHLNKEVRLYARANEAARFHALSLLKLGILHMQTSRWASADSALTKALTRAQDLGDLDYQRRILRALGRLHEMQNQWAAAEAYYRKGISVIKDYRESLTATQWSSTAFAQWRDMHRGLVRALLAQERPREALIALDRSRARHLQDLRTQARVVNQLPPDARARLDSLSRALSDVRTRLGKGTLSNAKEAALRTREAALMSARQQLLQPESTVSDRPSIDQTSEVLARRDRALVSYFLDDPWPVYDRSPRSAAFVLANDTLRVVPLPGLTQDSVQAEVNAISPLFRTRGKPRSINAMHFDLRPLHKLYTELYAPIAEFLPPGQPLTVVPDGPMFYVPFSMLASAIPGGRYAHSQARFVLHKRPTSFELATSMAGDTSSTSFDPSTFAPDLAAFGIANFDTLHTVPTALRATLSDAALDSSLALSDLPGVRTEMNTLKQLFGDVKTYFNEAATERAFTAASRRAGVLHLASHAFVHPSSPLQNAFLLRPDSTSDGFLFLHELQGRNRSIPLAVLSGCSTARGTLRGGEGMAGLQYAFRAMGAQSTVANLWPAADRPSVALMKSFYQHLQSGLSKDRALRQAKLEYLSNHPNQKSPFFWAPTVLYGSPQPMPLAERDGAPPWVWWILGLAILATLAGLSFWRGVSPVTGTALLRSSS